MSEQPQRNLALELVRATEAAALAAARWMGRGQKEAGDGAAVDAMRLLLNTVPMDGVVVIGEGEKDEAPMLYNGERVGTGDPPAVDIAVDPVEGTRLLALGRPDSIAVVALAPRGTMCDPGPVFYMNKIAVGRAAADVIDLDAPVADNLAAIARATGKDVTNLTVVVLDRPRHDRLIADIRAAGARIKLITDGDVAAALQAALPDTGVDVLMGIGGTPEGVITACALKCLGGAIHGRLAPQKPDEVGRAHAAGMDLDRVLMTDDLVRSDDVFFAATGLTDGTFLRGVQYIPHGAITDSIVMRGRSGTMRRIQAIHRFEKLSRISAVPYA
ncbi:MAG: class II fructose-bisphosphatase [Ardenticatenaceae bacterium]|nr:class II fructose-bisphosphatase [Ardenticatenaceae bacterium]HBY96411.1 class II fructose-bisphosphatase [Chloroflexota bacterium]